MGDMFVIATGKWKDKEHSQPAIRVSSEARSEICHIICQNGGEKLKGEKRMRLTDAPAWRAIGRYFIIKFLSFISLLRASGRSVSMRRIHHSFVGLSRRHFYIISIVIRLVIFVFRSVMTLFRFPFLTFVLKKIHSAICLFENVRRR